MKTEPVGQESEIILVNFEDHASYCLPNPIKVFFDLAKTLNMKDFSFHYSNMLNLGNLEIQTNNKHNIIIDDLDEKIMQLNFNEIKNNLRELAKKSGKNIFIFSRKTTSWFDISTVAVKRSEQNSGFEIKTTNFNSNQKSA